MAGQRHKLVDKLPDEEKVRADFLNLGSNAKDWIDYILTVDPVKDNVNTTYINLGRQSLAREIREMTFAHEKTKVTKNIED